MPNFDAGVWADQLQLALQVPAATHLWHQLYGTTLLAPPAARQAMLKRVRTREFNGGLGGFLAATFAHAVSNDVADLAVASRIFVAGHLPVDAGLALMHTVYTTALGSSTSTEGYAALLRASGFLDVAHHLGQRVAQRAGPLPRRSSGSQQPLRRVAVVAPTLSSAFHAPTDMTLRHASLLQEHGLEVAVFAAQEFQMLNMPNWLGVPRNMKIDPAKPEGWHKTRRPLPVKMAPLALSMGSRWHTLLQQIQVFAPDAVLFIGPYSPLLYALHQRYPTVGLGTNAVAPVGPLDVWLAPQAATPASWMPTFDAGAIVGYSHRLSLLPAKQARSRHDLGLPANAVVWVTTGSRLAREINPAWRDSVLAALARHPECHWLVVGQAQVDGLPSNHPRVHVQGFDADLPSLLKTCDIYLNPPRLGGGHSVACAMAQGLPVLSLPGSDGGDKVGPWAQPDLSQYFLALDQLSSQAAARRQLGEHLRQRYFGTFDLPAGAPTLLAALKTATQCQMAV